MKYYLVAISCLILACSQESVTALDESQYLETLESSVGDAYKETYESQDNKNQDPIPSGSEKDAVNMDVPPDLTSEQTAPPMPDYPPGPYSLELFKVLPDMNFYDPWRDEWISLSELYNHEKHKAFILVSSAGWCGPCLQEASALISLYEKYHFDGLEIIYTLGNTNVPGDVPFDTTAGDIGSAGFVSDILFMENWQLMTQDNAQKSLNYQMYADPNREFIKYFPDHAWPLSLLVTTKDMGIRLVEEGYWSALMENKVSMVLYNEVPDIPFN